MLLACEILDSHESPSTVRRRGHLHQLAAT